jgi:response regulator of citrate/malate metabolism
MIKCLIIEDEPLAAERLKNYIAQMPELQLERWFDTGTAAVAYLEEHSVDLIFLDLHLGETSAKKTQCQNHHYHRFPSVCSEELRMGSGRLFNEAFCL